MFAFVGVPKISFARIVPTDSVQAEQAVQAVANAFRVQRLPQKSRANVSDYQAGRRFFEYFCHSPFAGTDSMDISSVNQVPIEKWSPLRQDTLEHCEAEFIRLRGEDVSVQILCGEPDDLGAIFLESMTYESAMSISGNEADCTFRFDFFHGSEPDNSHEEYIFHVITSAFPQSSITRSSSWPPNFKVNGWIARWRQGFNFPGSRISNYKPSVVTVKTTMTRGEAVSAARSVVDTFLVEGKVVFWLVSSLNRRQPEDFVRIVDVARSVSRAWDHWVVDAKYKDDFSPYTASLPDGDEVRVYPVLAVDNEYLLDNGTSSTPELTIQVSVVCTAKGRFLELITSCPDRTWPIVESSLKNASLEIWHGKPEERWDLYS